MLYRARSIRPERNVEHESPSPDSFERYLRILDVAPSAPTLDSLRRLVRAQVIRVPFENISKLLSARHLGIREMPSLDRHLDGIERHGFGGTCYPNNYHFWSLLRHLGFDADLCGADMRSGPDVHIVILVRVEAREYLVDGGYAAPFCAPLPRDLDTPLEIPFGNERYVLHPRDPGGCSRVDHYRDGAIVHGYLAKPTPRDLGHFERIIRESCDDHASFMNAVRVTRYAEASAVSIRNHTLIRSTPDAVAVEKLPDRGAIIEAIDRHGGISRRLAREALDGLGELRDVED